LQAVREADATIERARIVATAARPEATRAAEDARKLAEGTSYAPVIARARLVEGRAYMIAGDKRARAILDIAMRAGFAAHDDATAIEAYARMVFVAIHLDDASRVDGTTVMDAVAARLGPNDVFARLLLVNNLAVAKQAAGDRAGARALLESALSEWRRVDDYELASIPQNLALAVDDPARSVALLGDARASVVRLLGSDHPRVSEIDQWRAMFRDLEHAREDVDGACRRLATMFPHLVAERADCEYEAGWLADEAGDRVAAATHFASARTGISDPSRAAVANAMASPMTAAAAATLERAGRDARTTADTPLPRILAGDQYMAAARGFEIARDVAGARRCWQAASELFAAAAIPFTARRLARAQAALAVLGRDPTFARKALAWYERVGGYANTIAELRVLAGER
jgi:hypothetical protein